METKDKKQVIIRWDVILTSMHIIALIPVFFNIFNYDVTSKYILCLGFIIFFEGLFICYIKKIIPRINRFILRIIMTILVRSHVNLEYHACEGGCEGTGYIPIMFFVQEFLCIILCRIGYIISCAIKITEQVDDNLVEGRKALDGGVKKTSVQLIRAIISLLIVLYLIYSLYK